LFALICFCSTSFTLWSKKSFTLHACPIKSTLHACPYRLLKHSGCMR
jgi:hypothetical protein